jgi:PAS domain-containing protein
MTWVTIIWSMIASACLTLAAMHLLIWCKKRTAWASLIFAVMAVMTATLAGLELWGMRAETAREYGVILRWAHVPYWVLIISLVVFIRVYLRAGRPWLAWTVCAMRTFALLLNFLVGQNLNYREVTGLRHVLYFGESVSVGEGVANPWMLVGQLSLLLLVIFVADATFAVWRRGDRQRLVLLGSTIIFFVMGGAGMFVLTFWGLIHIPVTASLFFLGIVAVMGYELSLEALRAAGLAEDLRKREEWLNLAADSAGVGLWLWDEDAGRIKQTTGKRSHQLRSSVVIQQ